MNERKKIPQTKAERQKRALQATTLALLNQGRRDGLSQNECEALFHGLVELDWIPRDVDPLKVLAEPLTSLGEPEKTGGDGG